VVEVGGESALDIVEYALVQHEVRLKGSCMKRHTYCLA